MLAEVQSGKDRLLAQEEGVVATVTGAPKAPRRKGGKLIALGILAAVGAGVAWWLSQQQSQPAADPWASKDGRPDPWAGSTTSTASTPSTTATTTGAVGGAAGASTMEGETTVSNDGQARMLDTEQIDDLGTETPSSVEEQAVGESPTEEIQSHASTATTRCRTVPTTTTTTATATSDPPPSESTSTRRPSPPGGRLVTSGRPPRDTPSTSPNSAHAAPRLVASGPQVSRSGRRRRWHGRCRCPPPTRTGTISTATVPPTRGVCPGRPRARARRTCPGR
ncbi:hypothetical protein BJF86_15060 [Serinicoccus sp. CNJ-927]|uniref:hypothetical protein n=1 Tax=Serinicoccus sp. CNJ-927 TaxID=1904970 RepID=UPI0009598319|nr:hypothetical protein [Serinicoccus sp. CNJ-927]OLT42431.1 hypothetical protein BJF86_15060 [Serinicoccus sp. CNJ-927]